MNVKHFIEDKLLLFEFTEELDHHASERIRKRADYEIQRFMPKRVILDFSRVTFMDSAGIGLIIGRYKTANYYNGKLELINVNDKVKRILKMSNVLELAPIIDDFKIKQIS